jgi:hypothetical protein
MPETDAAVRLRTANRKTALVLLSIALVFFVGVIATRFMGGPVTGIVVLGTAVLLFLVIAIGRNLRSTDGRAGRGPGPKGAPARESEGAGARLPDSPAASGGGPR